MRAVVGGVARDVLLECELKIDNCDDDARKSRIDQKRPISKQ